MLTPTQNRCSVMQVQRGAEAAQKGLCLDCWWKDFLPEAMRLEAGGRSRYTLWQSVRTGEGLAHLHLVRVRPGSEKGDIFAPVEALSLTV